MQQELWIENIVNRPTLIEIDSSAAVSMDSSNVSTDRCKHVSMRYHHINHLIQDNTIDTIQISSDAQVADGLTKPLNQKPLQKMVKVFALEAQRNSADEKISRNEQRKILRGGVTNSV